MVLLVLGSSSGLPNIRSSNSSNIASNRAPPRTHGAVVQQARAALRRFREDRAAGAAPKRSPLEPWRLLLDVPLPVASDIAAKGVPLAEAPFGLADEGDWPGGNAQRFRALRQVVEPLLEGYGSSFLGILESPSDGLGVWQLRDMVLAGIVVNATFPSFAKLCEGGYGAQPTQADQAVVVVAEWTGADDIGQPWQRDLKARARALIDDAEWRPLYSARMVRTSKGRAFGCLTAAWGEPWRLYPADSDESSSIKDDVLLESWSEPPKNDVVAALNSHAEQRQGGDSSSSSKGKIWW